MQRTRQMYRNEEGNDALSIMSLLPARRGLGVTNPKDMIYAHLSFAAGDHDESLVVDYSKSCAEIYEEFAYRELEYSSGIDILSHIGNHGSSSGLASWAPDWRQPKLTTPLHVEGPVARALLDYKENGMFEWHHVWVDKPLTLILLGHIVDSITVVSTPLSGTLIPPEKQSEFSARHDTIILDVGNISEPNHKTRVQLYADIYEAWRALVNDDHILPPHSHSDLNDGIDRVWDFYRYISHHADARGSIRDFEDEYYSYSRQVVDYLIAYFSTDFDKFLVDGRALARLASGRLALVPCDAREGDLILRLPGAEKGPHVFSYAEYGPWFVIRGTGTRIHTDMPELEQKIKSALAVLDEKSRKRWEFFSGRRFPLEIESGVWKPETFGLVREGKEDDFLSCGLVGECVVDTDRLPPRNCPSGVDQSTVDGKDIKIVAIG